MGPSVALRGSSRTPRPIDTPDSFWTVATQASANAAFDRRGGKRKFAAEAMPPKGKSVADIRPAQERQECLLKWYLAMSTQGRYCECSGFSRF